MALVVAINGEGLLGGLLFRLEVLPSVMRAENRAMS